MVNNQSMGTTKSWLTTMLPVRLWPHYWQSQIVLRTHKQALCNTIQIKKLCHGHLKTNYV